MPTPRDYEPVYPITVSLVFGTTIPDDMTVMACGQELCDVVAELYEDSFVGGAGKLKDKTITLFFTKATDARHLRDNWYLCRAKVLAEMARHQFSVDPDDIPF